MTATTLRSKIKADDGADDGADHVAGVNSPDEFL
jgi:hypothetical protein